MKKHKSHMVVMEVNVFKAFIAAGAVQDWRLQRNLDLNPNDVIKPGDRIRYVMLGRHDPKEQCTCDRTVVSVRPDPLYPHTDFRTLTLEVPHAV